MSTLKTKIAKKMTLKASERLARREKYGESLNIGMGDPMNHPFMKMEVVKRNKDKTLGYTCDEGHYHKDVRANNGSICIDNIPY